MATSTRSGRRAGWSGSCRNLELIWLLKNLKPGLPDDRQLPQGELGSPEDREPQFRVAASRA